MKKPWVVYILQCKDGTLYTGITNDLDSRLAKHNKGTGAKYTRSRLPVVCVWFEKKKNESYARKREAEIKSWPRIKKEKLLTLIAR